MQSFLAVKKFKSLRPADSDAEEEMNLIAEGSVVRVQVTVPTPRSLKQHRLFFSLLEIAAEHMGWTKEQVLCWAKLAVGHVDHITEARTGEVFCCPRSISFARMGGEEFKKFFDVAVTAVIERLMPEGTARADLVEECYGRAG